MNIKEIFEKIKTNLNGLQYEATYNSGNNNKPYYAKNLLRLKEAIREISDIPFVESQIKTLNQTSLMNSYKDEDVFTSDDNSKIFGAVRELNVGLQFLINYYYAKENIQMI